jgi:plastocyanin
MRRATILSALLGTLALGRPAAAATVSGVVTIGGRPAHGAVVYLEAAIEPAPPASARVVMDQRHMAFVPAVLPVVRGTTVDFTNSDDVQHNVFSPSTVANNFDLGTYKRGDVRRVTFDQPGEVRVLCNIHMEMEARILVLRDRFFATTRNDGGYAIPDVPPGAYTLKLWRERWLPADRRVEVQDTGTMSVDVAQ